MIRNIDALQSATAIIDRHIDFYEVNENERCLVNNVLKLVKKRFGPIEYDNLIQDFGMKNLGLETILV